MNVASMKIAVDGGIVADFSPVFMSLGGVNETVLTIKGKNNKGKEVEVQICMDLGDKAWLLKTLAIGCIVIDGIGLNE